MTALSKHVPSYEQHVIHGVCYKPQRWLWPLGGSDWRPFCKCNSKKITGINSPGVLIRWKNENNLFCVKKIYCELAFCCVYILCLFHWKYDDDVATIPPNLVRESIWSRFSFAVLSGGRFFQLPNRSWVAPSPSISPWLPLFEARDCLVFNAWGDQTWGISGPWRYWVAEDASVWGFRKSRDASQPVNL